MNYVLMYLNIFASPIVRMMGRISVSILHHADVVVPPAPCYLQNAAFLVCLEFGV